MLLRHLKPQDGFHKQKIRQRNRKEGLTILLLIYRIAGNFRGSKLSWIHPKIIFTELIFANFIIQPFCTVLFIISRISLSRISKNREKSKSYWPRKFPAIRYHMPENFHVTITFHESAAMPHLLCCSCGSFANYSLQEFPSVWYVLLTNTGTKQAYKILCIKKSL